MSLSSEIIGDGVVNQMAWDAAPLRVRDLNKNATKRPSEHEYRSIPDWIEMWSRGSKFNTRHYFYRMAQRAYTIQKRLIDWKGLTGVDRSLIAAAIRGSAVVNLSNSETSRKATPAAVRRWAATTDWPERISTIAPKPSIIICGGRDVFYGAAKRLGFETMQTASSWRSFRDLGREIIYVEAYHPSYWGGKARHDSALFAHAARLLENP